MAALHSALFRRKRQRNVQVAPAVLKTRQFSTGKHLRQQSIPSRASGGRSSASIATREFGYNSSHPKTHLVDPNSSRSFERKVDSTQFDDEPRRPFLGNLTTHKKDKHSDKLTKSGEDVDSTTNDPPRAAGGSHGYTMASVCLMDGFLEQGRLNPRKDCTRKGFLRIFAAWIIEEDLPWTTGEAPGLQQLFQYLRCQFVLPSDTTVRNVVAQIFADLHSEVVKELAVRATLHLNFELT